MNNTIISNWNSVIKDNDEVYILGNLTLSRCPKIASEYLMSLKGRKYLIKGNHDKYLNDNAFDRSLFELIVPYHEIRHEGYSYVLCHYPIADWNRKYRGSIHLYGHIHSLNWDIMQPLLGRCCDVGVDANRFTPVSIYQIVDRCKSIESLGLADRFIKNGKLNKKEELL